MIDFYDFYRYYIAREAISNPSSRISTPSIVVMVKCIRDSGTKSWLIDPMEVFKNLLTKIDGDRVKDCYDIERLHDIYPDKSPMNFAEAYIIYSLSGLSVAVTKYLPMCISDYYMVGVVVNDRLRRVRKGAVKGKRMRRNSTRVPKGTIDDLYKSLALLHDACFNGALGNMPMTVIEDCIANIVIFIHQFSIIHNISRGQLDAACQVHIVDDFKKYVIGE